MLFRELIDTRFKAFSRQKEDERLRNIATVRYVQTLASMANVDIMGWDAKAIFGTGTGNKLIEDKNEVNRLFFMEMERLQAQNRGNAAPTSSLLSDEVVAQIKAVEARQIAAIIARENNVASNKLREASRYGRTISNLVKEAGEAMKAADRLARQGTDIATQIAQVHNGTFWEFKEVIDARKIVFVTRNHVICTYKNQSAGIDITFDFGKFKAVFDMEAFNVSVYAIGRNTFCNSYYHPHISSSGSVCWGSALDAANRAMSSSDIANTMLLLASVLTSYNKDNPYQSIERFYDTANNSDDMRMFRELEAQRESVQAQLSQLDALPVNLTVSAIGAASPA